MTDKQTHRAVPNRFSATPTLREWVEGNSRALRGILRNTVAPLCRDAQEPGEVADELLSELVVELLKSADRYDPSRPPHAWAMGVALNIAKRWQERTIKRAQREFVPSYSSADGAEGDLCELLRIASSQNVERIVSDSLWARGLLERLTGDERDVVQALILDERPAVEVAAEWGVSAGSLRIRQYRALQRLRVLASESAPFVSGRAGSGVETGGVR